MGPEIIPTISPLSRECQAGPSHLGYIRDNVGESSIVSFS
jgi:hypothetical protein